MSQQRPDGPWETGDSPCVMLYSPSLRLQRRTLCVCALVSCGSLKTSNFGHVSCKSSKHIKTSNFGHVSCKSSKHIKTSNFWSCKLQIIKFHCYLHLFDPNPDLQNPGIPSHQLPVWSITPRLNWASGTGGSAASKTQRWQMFSLQKWHFLVGVWLIWLVYG